MAGHSKFKNIQHRKGAQDKKRAKIFNKMAREITVSAKAGLPDPDKNPRLRAAMLAARAVNMPNDRIKRAIEQANPANADAAQYDEVRYEGYGPAGVAVIVEALTDNRNRTVAEVRSAFSKSGGALGEGNAVSFMFDHVGSIVYPVDAVQADVIFDAAVEAGADNVESGEGGHEILTGIADFIGVKESLAKKFGEPESAALVWKPQNTISLNEEQAVAMLKLIDTLEDNDDVQNVFANFDIDDAIMEKLMEE